MSCRVAIEMLRACIPRSSTLLVRLQALQQFEIIETRSFSGISGLYGLLPPLSSTQSIPPGVCSRNIKTGLTHCRKLLPGTDEELDTLGKGDRVLKVRLATTRLDGILKTGLQISKNKIEKAFYEDRIRINGDRPRKKSQLLAEGDEVDIVRGLNKMNKEFLDVSRVEVVTLNEEGVGHSDDEYTSDEEETSESKIPAVLKRYKSLTIENYSDPWKGSVVDS